MPSLIIRNSKLILPFTIQYTCINTFIRISLAELFTCIQNFAYWNPEIWQSLSRFVTLKLVIAYLSSTQNFLHITYKTINAVLHADFVIVYVIFFLKLLNILDFKDSKRDKITILSLVLRLSSSLLALSTEGGSFV